MSSNFQRLKNLQKFATITIISGIAVVTTTIIFKSNVMITVIKKMNS